MKNFGSKILGGIKKVAGWIAPTVHKILGGLSGPVSLLHPDYYGGTDPNVISFARQYILALSLQNLSSVPVLFTPHNIGLPAEQLTEPLLALHEVPVLAITDPLKDR
ncbi:MAG: hypothetical protein EZS28_032799, partial [Streblomastix strix]